MLIKYQFLKKKCYGKNAHLNTLWDMMVMITLDHYV